jgi:tetratricopeptide (TPR) repeat protein
MKSPLPRRRLIPKWRPIATTLKTTEATSTDRRETKILSGDPDELDQAIAQWRVTNAPGLLGEVLSFSVHHNLVNKVIDFGQEALQSGAAVTGVQARLIHDLGMEGGTPELPFNEALLVSGKEVHPFQSQIRRLRALLRSAPDNPFALLDYAQLQAAVGKLESAKRALRTALSLAPNNRIVIRTAARFFVHVKQPDFAHYIIRRHSRTPFDPWLMASEIALADAAGIESSFLLKGKRLLLEQTKFSPAHLSELAGVVAVSELAVGNLKRAREAQRKALLVPNDNVIAQAIDQERFFGIQLDTPQVVKALAESSEALVLQAWARVMPKIVEQHAQAWHTEEPFSSRPIQMLTTLYAYKGELELAILWIKAGLLADPNDLGLLINLAFVQARLGQIAEAEVTIRKLRSLDLKFSEPFTKATEGLIAYQQHRFEAGDKLYDWAVLLFEKSSKPGLAAYCRLNQVFSALDYQHPGVNEIMRKANDAHTAHPTLDSAMLIKLRTAPDIADIKNVPQEMRRLSQWMYDPTTNTLTERTGITAVGAKPLVILERKL